MNPRRRLLLGAASALALGVNPARAQSGAAHRIAFLSGGTQADAAGFFPSLVAALADYGYREGQNLVLDRGFANYSAEQAAKLAAAMAAQRPAVVVANGSGIGAAVRLSPAIPVVFLHSGDPVDAGLVDSYPRPGRNATGVSMMALDLIAKRVELLKQIQPQLRRLAFLASPEHAGQRHELAASQAAAAQFDIAVNYYEARTPAELAGVLPKVAADKPDAALLFSDALMVGQRRPLAEFFLRHRIPSAAGWIAFPEAGHLLSYGPERGALWKRLAYFVDRILKGARPADLPVELPAVVEFGLNRRTATQMKLHIPPAMLARADRIIDTAL
ncbi:MAG TPA: ABC transporter substrate-binding protein [Burkholderiales bacterium]|nr:ABC transporter substrate-binding protein [Burkholderiales bacterium]